MISSVPDPAPVPELVETAPEAVGWEPVVALMEVAAAALESDRSGPRKARPAWQE
jgi:hypothetical protein